MPAVPHLLLQPDAVSLSLLEHSGEFYVGWGTLALINANLAQTKRRSGGGWFVVSLVLGPLATLLLAVIGPPDRPTEARGR